MGWTLLMAFGWFKGSWKVFPAFGQVFLCRSSGRLASGKSIGQKPGSLSPFMGWHVFFYTMREN